jgi:hypothetical protein
MIIAIKTLHQTDVDLFSSYRMRTITLRYTSLLFHRLASLCYDLVLRFYLSTLFQRRTSFLVGTRALR